MEIPWTQIYKQAVVVQIFTRSLVTGVMKHILQEQAGFVVFPPRPCYDSLGSVSAIVDDDEGSVSRQGP